jgi:auxin-responsive protein IAA
LPARKKDISSYQRYGMELELGLAPPSARHPIPMAIDHDHHHPCAARAGKRWFAEAFHEATTLPLFDDGSSCGERNGGSKRPLVGWPPVSSARSRACGGAKYVKVKKEGDAIGRKVDLSLHASYDELLATLARMFPTTTGNQGRYQCSLLVYQNSGDLQSSNPTYRFY